MNITRYDVRAGDRPAGASFASRSAVYGCSGAAGTAHPYSTLTAIDILKGGGSAADAAVAAAACLGFLEPTGSGLGGDCYALIWDPSVSKVTGLAGSGRSPKSLSLDTVRSRSPHGLIAPYGAIAVSTPGALDAWWTMHQRFGRLKWGEVFEPAIAMCERGVPVPQVISHHWQRDLEVLREPGSRVEEWVNAMRTYAPAGHAPREGDLFRNPDLACTYRTIAEGGRDAFYEGDIARTIDAYFRRIGGWLSLEDLKAHRSEWVDPLVSSYRGVDVYAMGANTQGLATLQMLNILENFDLRSMGFQSAESIHTQAEAKRLAYEDRARHYADPDFSDVPTAWLNSKAYAAERAKLIADPSLVEGAVEEVLRMYPAFASFRRTATKDVELHGKTIHAGDKVVMWYPSANRDESVYGCPHMLDVERNPEHQAFGAGGRHFCLGTALARLELRILIEETLARYPNIELAGAPERTDSFFINQLRSLPVKLA